MNSIAKISLFLAAVKGKEAQTRTAKLPYVNLKAVFSKAYSPLAAIGNIPLRHFPSSALTMGHAPLLYLKLLKLLNITTIKNQKSKIKIFTPQIPPFVKKNCKFPKKALPLPRFLI